MPRSSSRHRPATAAAAAACLALVGSALVAQPAVAADDVLDPSTTLYVDWTSSTLEHAAGLDGEERDDALLLASVPTATWFTSGTPAQVQAEVDALVGAAAAQGAVPTVVAYNLPFRDCAQYSAGGARDTAEYAAWIDGVAAGIGDREAIVVLEPDGLGIIPWYTPVGATSPEWCQPAELDPATAAADRFTQLNHAVDALTALPQTAVYLDGTHTGWLSVGDVTDRLIKAGVESADGFFLNASNYQRTERLERYAGWVSDCLALSTSSEPSAEGYEPSMCGSQYFPASPDDLATWDMTDAKFDEDFAATGLVRDRAAQKHAVLDTSRNGQGPWTPPAGVYPDPEDWCNPPDRGLGLLPTTDTGNPVIDALLWIKVPGESDGQCYRGLGGPLDPVRGIQDPPAGQWFPEQAAELLALAEQPLAEPTCAVRVDVRERHGLVRGKLRLTNTGTDTVSGWDLQFALPGDVTVERAWGAQVSQSGLVVTGRAPDHRADLRPGRSHTVGFLARGDLAAEPLLVLLDGEPCRVS
ncbi:glycoside hydrolase family 6 protein [Cellulomonas sp. ATA003]|uniref:glycoside hydrolase family 6 protein n=1 Tax=Cellulomonas sp. ATA003 TaxID=3073064 RepID=UPI002873252F|nr:glycoside hydrolase family 6 protein [Cellulomonas sp. ATA003]WNB86061.1 glycoside hydrolase family 6 protein [Cellulomonas sp. ATA003]